MKIKTNAILFTAGCLLVLSACNSSDSSNDSTPSPNEKTEIQNNITYKGSHFLAFKPYIAFTRQGAFVGQQTTAFVELPLQPGIDKNDLKIDWSVLDENANQLLTATTETISWTSESAGTFTVKAVISSLDETIEVLEKLFVLDDTTVMGSETQTYQIYKQKLAGRWIGKVSNPWSAPYLVELQFNDDGTYSAKSLTATYYSPSNAGETLEPALYYGTDSDSPYKRYDLTNIMANGEGTGTMSIVFDANAESDTNANIEHLRFDAGYNRMFFELWQDNHGPIRFSLMRLIENEREDSLQKIQTEIAGHWTGAAATPWSLPYGVDLTFRDDGTYSAQADSWGQSAFYYGTDADSPLKLYSIDDLTTDGKGTGQIDIVFDLENTTRDSLRNIRFSSDYNILLFDFWHSDQYGPVSFIVFRDGTM